MKTRILVLLLLFPGMLLAQQKGVVKGVIKTSDGQPAAYVNVALKNTSKGDYTNVKGQYEIRNIDPGQYTLVVSSVGLETREEVIAVKGGETVVLSFELRENAQELNEVVITDNRINPYSKRESDFVSKMPLENLENAQVYSTITKDLLQEQLVFSVDDAIKNAPGVQKMWEATGRGGDGGSFYNSRGFVLQSQLRNGIAGNISSRIDAANLESIEVIKGPSATLFGSTLTSYGGLINRVTKKPYDYFGGEIAYSTGSYGFNRISLDVNTPLNEDKTVLLRLNTAYNYEGTFQDNGFEKSFVIAPSLSYVVNDKLTFNFDAELFNGQNTSRQFIFFYYPMAELGASNPKELGIEYNRTYSSNDIFQESKNRNFFAQATYKISGRWTSQTNFTSTHSYSDGPYAYFYVVPNKYVTGNDDDLGADYLARADQSTAASEITVKEFQQNFIGDFELGGMRNRLVVGLDLFAQNSNQLFYGADFDRILKNTALGNGAIPGYSRFTRDKLDSLLSNGTTWTYPVRFKSNTYSAYVSDVLNITDKLIASVALRIDHFDNKGQYDLDSAKYRDPYTQTALAPRFGLVYQAVADKVAFFANYQNGFTNQTGVDYQRKPLKPEQANQWEGGIKIDAFNGKLSSTISYYHIDVKDVVRPYIGNINELIQDGAQVSKGFEVEVIANPVEGFNIVTGVAYNDSEFERSSDDVAGRRPDTAMSPLSVNAWLSYKLQRGMLRGLGFGFGGNHASDNKIVNSDFMGVFTLPAYTVLNAAVFYDHTKFRAGLKVDNLTDEHYWIGYTTMNPQKLRSVTANFTLKF